MNNKKLIYAVLAAVIALALIVLAIRIVNGAFALLGGAVNTVLGIVVLAVLAVIVIWMFRYAKRH